MYESPASTRIVPLPLPGLSAHRIGSKASDHPDGCPLSSQTARAGTDRERGNKESAQGGPPDDARGDREGTGHRARRELDEVFAVRRAVERSCCVSTSQKTFFTFVLPVMRIVLPDRTRFISTSHHSTQHSNLFSGQHLSPQIINRPPTSTPASPPRDLPFSWSRHRNRPPPPDAARPPSSSRTCRCRKSPRTPPAAGGACPGAPPVPPPCFRPTTIPVPRMGTHRRTISRIWLSATAAGGRRRETVLVVQTVDE